MFKSPSLDRLDDIDNHGTLAHFWAFTGPRSRYSSTPRITAARLGHTPGPLHDSPDLASPIHTNWNLFHTLTPRDFEVSRHPASSDGLIARLIERCPNRSTRRRLSADFRGVGSYRKRRKNGAST